MRRVAVFPITAVSGRVGWYSGQTYSGRFHRSASGDFVSSNIGQLSSLVDCIICSPVRLPLHEIVVGDAGPTTDAGKLMVFVNASSQMVLVTVTNDGGADGSLSTTATWTYTVKDTGGRTLGTALTPKLARPKGKVAFAPADTFGLATYSGSDLILLQAFGELRRTGSCAS